MNTQKTKVIFIDIIKTTILFFIVLVVWDLAGGEEINWIKYVSQSVLMGIFYTILMLLTSKNYDKEDKEVV